jgi:hypothetical protein
MAGGEFCRLPGKMAIKNRKKFQQEGHTDFVYDLFMESRPGKVETRTNPTMQLATTKEG